jgi:hypothetical protein
MKEVIQKMNPPGILKPNRGAVFSAIGKVFGKVNGDALKAFNAHFPYLSDSEKLAQHGKALSIPRVSYDTDEEYRKRVTAAAFYLANAGDRTYTISQLKEHFGERYILDEQFLQITLKVLDLTDADKRWLREFLDGTLNPNILIAMFELFDFSDTVLVQVQESPQVSLVKQEQDIYTNGLRYDGRIKYDHGKEITFDGIGTYSGSWKYNQFIPQKGTVSDSIRIPESYSGSRTYGGEIHYSGDAPLYAPMDTPNPASYGDGNQEDTLAIQVGISTSDTAALEPRYDGQLRLDGQVSYGGIQPSVIDAIDITITNRVSHTETVEIAEQSPPLAMKKTELDVYPAGLRYDGRINYDHGQVLRFDGAGTYGGAWNYCNIIPRKGTVIDEIHGDIPNPASYNSNTDTDTIHAQLALQALEDRAAIQPLYNGLFRYQGHILHGDTLPACIDMDMVLRVIKPFRYDGKKKYYSMPYGGITKYDGTATYGGATYKGDTSMEEEV